MRILTTKDFVKTTLLLQRTSARSGGFTLIELLVVLIMLALLAALPLAARSTTKHEVDIAQCASNLRQLDSATHLFAVENNDALPLLTGAASWAWNMPWSFGDTMLGYGVPIRSFYCPGTAPRFTDDDNFSRSTLSLWTFGAPTFHVIGYIFALGGPGSALIRSNQNTTIGPEAPSLTASVKLAVSPSSARVLIADATISTPSQGVYSQRYSYNYTFVTGGFTKPHLSPHLNGNFPEGGNVAFKDGHVEWRKFDSMDQRTTTGPSFWW